MPPSALRRRAVLSFVFLKGVNVSLNGARGIALAAILGPKSYGVFGSLIIAQQYLSYLALGMREGVAIRLAQLRESPEEVSAIHSSALVWGGCVGLLALVVLSVLHYGLQWLPRSFVWVGLLSMASIVNEILININRNDNKLLKIASMELIFQATALVLVLALWKWLTVERALQALLAGLVLGLSGYAVTLRAVRRSAVSWQTMRWLLGVGILPAVLSAISIVFSSLFVMAANWMKLGSTIGLVVFAANISTLILFGLNTLSWGLAARSMKRLYLRSPPSAAPAQVELVDVAFRLGVIVAALIALAGPLAFTWVMKAYALSADFILYCCLFQSYGLLLFSESNFLTVNARLRPVLAGYLVMIAILAAVLFLAPVHFLTFIEIAIGSYFLLSVAVTAYCRRHGFSGGSFAERIVALSFPVWCLIGNVLAGATGAVAVCGLFLALNLALHHRRAAAFLMARGPRGSAK